MCCLPPQWLHEFHWAERHRWTVDSFKRKKTRFQKRFQFDTPVLFLSCLHLLFSLQFCLQLLLFSSLDLMLLTLLSWILSFRYLAVIRGLFFILLTALFEMLHDSDVFMHWELFKIICLMESAVWIKWIIMMIDNHNHHNNTSPPQALCHVFPAALYKRLSRAELNWS